MTVKAGAPSSSSLRRLLGVAAAAAILLLAACGKGGDGEKGATASHSQKAAAAALAPLEKTFAALQETVLNNPEDTVSRVYLARHYIRAAGALRAAEEKAVFFAMADHEAGIALGLAPGDRNVRRLYGETAILSRDFSRAMRVFEDLVYEDLEGKSAEDSGILFGLYVLQQNVDRGILFFRTKLKRAPESMDARYLLGLLHALAGDRRIAAGHLKVLAEKPSTPAGMRAVSRKLAQELDR
ncbi:MAG: hypothetical protein JXO51_04685 [Candidatus Aminicenantes bacterium]|nr:hypothetical protein [Candidatus Aminicenantes bacterium]